MVRRRAKTPLHEIGTDPDVRFTYANERTFLAWNRTALALIATGVAATQLLPALDIRFGRRILGLPLIAMGRSSRSPATGDGRRTNGRCVSTNRCHRHRSRNSSPRHRRDRRRGHPARGVRCALEVTAPDDSPGESGIRGTVAGAWRSNARPWRGAGAVSRSSVASPRWPRRFVPINTRGDRIGVFVLLSLAGLSWAAALALGRRRAGALDPHTGPQHRHLQLIAVSTMTIAAGAFLIGLFPPR